MSDGAYLLVMSELLPLSRRQCDVAWCPARELRLGTASGEGHSAESVGLAEVPKLHPPYRGAIVSLAYHFGGTSDRPDPEGVQEVNIEVEDRTVLASMRSCCGLRGIIGQQGNGSSLKYSSGVQYFGC